MTQWLRAMAVGLLALIGTGSVLAQVTSERQYLSGKDRDSAVDWEFFCTAGAKSGVWTTIPVPSCWDVKGFGNLSYYHDDPKLPFEIGKYRHQFEVPTAWKDRRTFLVFAGVMTDTDARLNGKSVGPVHQGGFYQFKYDVTDLLTAGTNLLEVDVKKHSDNESINKAERTADFWLFGGIFRPVYLESVPWDYIDRVAIDARADGAFSADVITPKNETADAVRVDLIDSAGKTIAAGTSKPGARVTTKAIDIKPWTAETPNLYTARFRLMAGTTVLHEMTKRFGFRTIEVCAGDGVYVNGRRIVLKGVCHHSFWPDSGRTLSPKIDEYDIGLIQSMNMNAVRMSHYPPDESFLDLCDERGLYVLDEMTSWQKKYDDATAIRLAGETVRRDVNHPSILFWDNGNEGGWNTAADPEFGKWDPQHRAVLHPWALHDNVNTKHYPTYTALKKLLAGPDVVMPTEFLHGLYDGGAGAGFRDYWDLMKSSPKSAGGFFWVFADEGILHDGKIDVVGNAAPDGILGPYRQKEASYYTIRDIWSPIVLPATLPTDFSGQIALKNGYDFTSLDQVKFRWSLLRWNALDDSGAGHHLEPGHWVLDTGEATLPGVRPSKSGVLNLKLPDNWKSADALMITAIDPKGMNLIDRVYPLDAGRSYAPSETVSEASVVTGDIRTLTSGDVELKIDAGTGVIRSVTRAGQDMPFRNGPRLAMGAPVNSKLGHPEGKLTDVKWAAGQAGWFKLSYAIEAKGPCDYLGVTFDFPEQQVKSSRWLGMGPYRVYQNRMEGGTIDVWEQTYNNTITGWADWNYPEMKGYHADIRSATLKTSAGAITIVPESRELFLHLLTPELPSGKLPRHAMVSYPEGTISLLQAIPAIGNKMVAAAETGPQGQPFMANGTYRATVWVRFN